MQQTTQTTQTALNAQSGMVAAAVASTASVASSAAAAAAASAAGAMMQVAGQSSSNYFNVVRPDGSEYAGQMRGDKPHGNGTLTYNKTAALHALPTGVRIVVSIEGGVFDGTFSNGERHGSGKLRFNGTDLKTYDGMWADDVMSGQGKLTWRDGSTYEGLFKDGYVHSARRRPGLHPPPLTRQRHTSILCDLYYRCSFMWGAGVLEKCDASGRPT